MAVLASDLLRHFRLLWNRWTEFNETRKEARPQRSLPSFLFFGPVGNPRWPPWSLIGLDIYDPLNRIQRNLTVCKIWKSSTMFEFFGSIENLRWLSLALIDWYIFEFCSENAERNLTKLCRKQDLNDLYQACVFGPIGKPRWLSWCLISWYIIRFSLKPLNRIPRNLTESKISVPSTKFVYFGPIIKSRWQRLHLIGLGTFCFFSETAKRNSTKLDRKQDLKVFY